MKKTSKNIVRHYTRKGWVHARLVRRGRKWAKVLDLGRPTRIANGISVPNYHRIPVSEVREALWQ